MKTRLMIVVAVAAVAVACHDGGEGPGGGPEELRLSGAIKGEVVARGAAAGEVIAAGEVVHAWVDEAVNPAVAHVKAWLLEADGNGGLDGTTCYFPENANDVNNYDAREFRLRDQGGGDGVSQLDDEMRGGAYAGRGGRRGESREVGLVVRHRAGRESREGE